MPFHDTVNTFLKTPTENLLHAFPHPCLEFAQDKARDDGMLEALLDTRKLW